MHFSLLLEQGKNEMDNPMFSGNEIPSKLGLLLVDDEEFNLKALKRTLRGQGFDIFCAHDGESALKIMEKEDVAIIVSDMRMPNMSGDELLIKIGERWPDTLKIILTGYTDISNTLNVLGSSSIFRYLSKPWDDELLLSTIHEASSIYWGKVVDFYFEQSTKEENKKLQDSNLRLRESVDQSHYQLKKINEKLKSAYDGEKKLRKERHEAERESIAKSQFLATMSHEIRTPLNSIIATSSLLLESQLNDEQKELVKLSLSGGSTLLSLINDILDFSKINAGKLDLQEEWFNLLQVVDETCELLCGQIINKPVEIVSIISPGTPLEIYGDRTRVQQIITNLLSNALKFTDYGCVTVEVAYEAELKISVQDSGIGMSKEDVRDIFEKFTQVDTGNARAKQGTGLGLSICRQLTHLMQGKIEVSSSPNAGSTFSVSLPLASRNPLAYPTFDKKPCCMLLVSINKHLHEALAKQFRFFNCNLEFSNDIPSSPDEKFSAILYDTDSICTTNEHEHKSHHALTSDGIEVALISNDGIARSKDIKNQGFKYVLRKPFRVSSIVKHIIYQVNPLPDESILSDEQRATIQMWAKTENETISSVKTYSLNASILLAEDSLANQAVIRSVLKNMNITVDTANNGEEAVKLANEKLYDVILMDMSMPVMDGVSAATEIIKSSNVNSQTPILALTANAYAQDREDCINAGMVDFLQKPIDLETFRETIAKYCKRLKKTPPTPSIYEEISNLDNSNIAVSKGVNSEIIDLNVIKRLERDTSEGALPRIIDIYLNETNKRLPAMLQYCREEDWSSLSREAHTLKSSSASFGAMKLSDIARIIEDSLKQKEFSIVRGEVEKLSSVVTSTLDILIDIKTHGIRDL